MIRRAGHRLLYVASVLALALVYVPAAVLCGVAGDWLEAQMDYHERRACK